MPTDKIHTSYGRRENRQHEFRQSYIHRNRPSVCPCIAAVTRLNGGSPTRISIGSRVFRVLDQVSNSSSALTWLLVTLPLPPSSIPGYHEPGVVSMIGFQISEVSWRVAAVCGNWANDDVALVLRRRGESRAYVGDCPSRSCLSLCLLSRDPVEQGAHLSRSLHAPRKILYGRRDRSD